MCIRSELKELVKLWAEQAFRLDFSIFAYGSFGESDLGARDFMRSRVDRISEVLGDSEVHEIVNYVKSKLCAEDKGWDIFFNGTKEQREAILEEYKQRWLESK